MGRAFHNYSAQFFHVLETSVTGPSSTAVETAEKKTKLRGGAIVAISIAIATCICLVLWISGTTRSDPYVKATLNTQGSLDKGVQLFRINCAGCHGIDAQGLLGPNLHEVSSRLSDPQMIHQLIDGRTPPMPSFKMEPEQMADLLVYLHSIN